MTAQTQSQRGPSGDKMPVLFIGHGSPTLALDAEKGAEFRAWGQRLPRPRGALMISAHWLSRGSQLELGPLERQPLIYDFYGFPQHLYHVEYNAPGGGLIAQEVMQALGGFTARYAGQGVPEPRLAPRGLDHGAWTPLVHLWPAADIPVLQLTIPMHWPAERWFEVGRALAPLRESGIMIIGSGNITHNLRRIDPRAGAPVPDWAQEFDAWTKQALDEFRMDNLLAYKQQAPALALNHPTEDHLAPLFFAAGAASEGGRPEVRYAIEGWEFGSLSRRSVQFG